MAGGVGGVGEIHGGSGVKRPIDSIEIGERRREDMGDLVALERSIERYGLIQPVVVDDSGRLVAGGRRLEACKGLGWAEIDVRPYGALSDTELRELELEENIRRKDLTEAERSRIMVGRAAIAEELVRQEPLPEPSGVFANGLQKPKGGRPPKLDSEQRVADRIGVNRETLRQAKAHVTALEDFPELDQPVIGQQEAIEAAQTLRSLDDERQARGRAVIREQRQQEQAKSQELLAKAGVLDSPEVQRAQLRAAFTRGVKHTHSELLMLDALAVADALSLEDDVFTRRFMVDCRAWLDALEHALGRGIHLVGREG